MDGTFYVGEYNADENIYIYYVKLIKSLIIILANIQENKNFKLYKILNKYILLFVSKRLKPF